MVGFQYLLLQIKYFSTEDSLILLGLVPFIWYTKKINFFPKLINNLKVGGTQALIGAVMCGTRNSYYREEDLVKYKNKHHFLPRFQYDRENNRWKVNHNVLHNPLSQSIGIWILWTAW